MEHPARDPVRVAAWVAVCSVISALAFFIWLVGPHNPDLTPFGATALIEARPEFNRYATLVDVSHITRGRGSLQEKSSADFTFLEHGSTALIRARAEFYYNEGAWHLQCFSWGDPPNARFVCVAPVLGGPGFGTKPINPSAPSGQF
jgi:hypothetical protein